MAKKFSPRKSPLTFLQAIVWGALGIGLVAVVIVASNTKESLDTRSRAEEAATCAEVQEKTCRAGQVPGCRWEEKATAVLCSSFPGTNCPSSCKRQSQSVSCTSLNDAECRKKPNECTPTYRQRCDGRTLNIACKESDCEAEKKGCRWETISGVSGNFVTRVCRGQYQKRVENCTSQFLCEGNYGKMVCTGGTVTRGSCVGTPTASCRFIRKVETQCSNTCGRGTKTVMITSTCGTRDVQTPCIGRSCVEGADEPKCTARGGFWLDTRKKCYMPGETVDGHMVCGPRFGKGYNFPHLVKGTDCDGIVVQEPKSPEECAKLSPKGCWVETPHAKTCIKSGETAKRTFPNEPYCCIDSLFVIGSCDQITRLDSTPIPPTPEVTCNTVLQFMGLCQ